MLARRTAVLVVVVALAVLDVLGQRGGHRRLLAVALDDVGHVIADHAAEPADLVTEVGQVVADVGRRRNADGDVVGVTARSRWPRSRTAPIVHSAIDGSASWRMKPSQVSPISFSAFGP